MLEWLRKCAAALKPGGLVIVKENICASGFIVDEEDSSLTRSDAYVQVRMAKHRLLAAKSSWITRALCYHALSGISIQDRWL